MHLCELISPDNASLLVCTPSLTCLSLHKALISVLYSVLTTRSDHVDQELANFLYKRPDSKYVWLRGHMVCVISAVITQKQPLTIRMQMKMAVYQ